MSMNILITGGRGLVGSALSKHWRALGHRVFIASRSAKGDDVISWNPSAGEVDLSSISPLDAVVHLAGENLAKGRWTASKKERILESRRQGTRTIAQAIARLETKPKVLISASGSNYYRVNTPEVMTEASLPGDDFLAEVCKVWEVETQVAKDAGIRVMNARMGVVLSADGGALATMLPPFKLGLGGRLGTGRQRMSWIDLADVVGVFTAALTDERYGGPINVVAPEAVTNADFTKALGKAIHRWTPFPVPAFALKILFGEMAEATLLADLALAPAKLHDLGYRFEAPTITQSLESHLGK